MGEREEGLFVSWKRGKRKEGWGRVIIPSAGCFLVTSPQKALEGPFQVLPFVTPSPFW